MNRNLNAMLLIQILKNVKYVPRIIWTIKNWPTYMLYYLGIKKGGCAYYFRNGAVIEDQEGTASGTIAVVFVRRHYGSIINKSTVIDIGANIGTFSIYAAMSDRNVHIYAYEPIKANYDLLLRNIEQNNCKAKVKAFNLGVASNREKRTFYLSSSPEHSLTKGDSCNASVSVSCLCLQDILEDNKLLQVDLLKINAEGAEYEILYSTPKEYFNRIDEIRMEYHKDAAHGHNLECLIAFLDSMGYVKTYLYKYTNNEGFLWMKKSQG